MAKSESSKYVHLVFSQKESLLSKLFYIKVMLNQNLYNCVLYKHIDIVVIKIIINFNYYY